LILGNAVALLDFSLELFTLAVDLCEIIVGEFAPLFFDFSSGLLPTSFDPQGEKDYGAFVVGCFAFAEASR
jgi:hypothetical protein